MTRGALFLLAAALLSGCSRTVSEDDCRQITDHMREVWQAEARKASTDGVPDEKAAAVIRAEGERLVSSFATECKKELKGRRVDAKEVDCLLKAKTVEQITKCSEP